MAIKALPAITFPHSFCAGNTYRWGLAVFSGMGLFATGFAIAHRQYSSAAMSGVMSLGFLFLFAAILSLRIRVDETGVAQSWLIGKASVTWDSVTRVDRSRRSYSIHIADGTEPIMLSFLSAPGQTATAKEAIARARLSEASGKLEYPVVERWTRG